LLIIKIERRKNNKLRNFALRLNPTKRSYPMKNFKLVLILLGISLILSCDKDNDDISLSAVEANKLSMIVKQGEWKISSFVLNDAEHTASYTDYLFTFEENNNLKATSSTDQQIGTWRVSNDSGSEFDSYYDVDFNLFFTSDSKFGEITNNYDVISATNQEIRLSLQENQNGNTGLLTFSRN